MPVPQNESSEGPLQVDRTGRPNPRAKLTERQRRVVVSMQGIMSPHELIRALDLDVTPEAIYNIWRRVRKAGKRPDRSMD